MLVTGLSRCKISRLIWPKSRPLGLIAWYSSLTGRSHGSYLWCLTPLKSKKTSLLMQSFNLILVYPVRTIGCGSYDHFKNFKLMTSFRNSLTISMLSEFLLTNRKISSATGFVCKKRGKLQYIRHRPQKWEKVSFSSPNYPSIPKQANYAALSSVTSLVVFLLLEQFSRLVSLCHRLYRLDKTNFWKLKIWKLRL